MIMMAKHMSNSPFFFLLIRVNRMKGVIMNRKSLIGIKTELIEDCQQLLILLAEERDMYLEHKDKIREFMAYLNQNLKLS